jgi:ABC-type phosphate/phosphonate transport system substrate-binding protein
MSTERKWLSAALMAVGVVLAGCGAGAPAATPMPSQTPTPMSTALPTLVPTLAAGSEENPIQFVVVTQMEGRRADNAADALQTALSEATGLTVQVTLTESDRDAVAALCAAFDGPPALAFVSAPAYSAAVALDCGLPLLLAVDGDSAALEREVILIASEESEIGVLADVVGKTFCRLSAADLVTWQAPSLLMLAEGLMPTTALRAVLDVPDLDTLVERVAAGDCDVAALDAADFERIADEEARAAITRLPQTVTLPLGMVMAAPEVPLGARDALQDALREYARTADGASALSDVFGASGLALPASDSLAGWDAFMARTGFDFAAFNR